MTISDYLDGSFSPSFRAKKCLRPDVTPLELAHVKFGLLETLRRVKSPEKALKVFHLFREEHDESAQSLFQEVQDQYLEWLIPDEQTKERNQL